MKVQDMMTSNPTCCSPTDTLHTAAGLMWKHDVGSLPVVDAKGSPIAMITDRDIAMHAGIRGIELSKLKVANCMSDSLWSCAPGDTLEAAERVFRDRQVHRLPVVVDNRIEGILSLHDIARSIGAKKSAATAVVKTFGAVARPRSTQMVAK